MSEAARKLFKAFHGREPAPGEIGTIRAAIDDDVLVVGELTRIAYRSVGDGKEYIHTFRKNARPVLAVTDDGKQAYVIAGSYGFTERGFVDRPSKRRKKK